MKRYFPFLRGKLNELMALRVFAEEIAFALRMGGYPTFRDDPEHALFSVEAVDGNRELADVRCPDRSRCQGEAGQMSDWHKRYGEAMEEAYLAGKEMKAEDVRRKLGIDVK